MHFCTACHLRVLIGLRTTLILAVNQDYSIIKRTKEICFPVVIFSALYRGIHEKNETDVRLIDSILLTHILLTHTGSRV